MRRLLFRHRTRDADVGDLQQLFAHADWNPDLVKTVLVFVALRESEAQSEQFTNREEYERDADLEKNEGHVGWD